MLPPFFPFGDGQSVFAQGHIDAVAVFQDLLRADDPVSQIDQDIPEAASAPQLLQQKSPVFPVHFQQIVRFPDRRNERERAQIFRQFRQMLQRIALDPGIVQKVRQTAAAARNDSAQSRIPLQIQEQRRRRFRQIEAHQDGADALPRAVHRRVKPEQAAHGLRRRIPFRDPPALPDPAGLPVHGAVDGHLSLVRALAPFREDKEGDAPFFGRADVKAFFSDDQGGLPFPDPVQERRFFRKGHAADLQAGLSLEIVRKPFQKDRVGVI